MSQSDLKTAKQKIQQMGQSPSNDNNMLFEVVKGNQAHIIFNRPKQMNAFSFDMYFKFTQFIQKANQMEDIKYIVFRGAGGNFSSGNDLKNFTHPALQNLPMNIIANTMSQILQLLTEVIIKSKKPIFALVQGKAIGFAFTQLALYDKVFAVENSYFMAPLVKTAQGPQMASSYLFPKIFGQSLASQIIINAKPMTAKDLEKHNLLTSFSNIDQAHQALQKHIQELEKLEWKSYSEARKLMRLSDSQNILKANYLECQNLIERWSNPDLPAFLMNYLASNKKSKL